MADTKLDQPTQDERVAPDGDNIRPSSLQQFFLSSDSLRSRSATSLAKHVLSPLIHTVCPTLQPIAISIVNGTNDKLGW
jgi:hypothetical protein